MKNQKGVNLVSLSVTVIIILAIAGTVLYNVRTNLGVQRLKAMQADIENLKGKVDNYYIQYGALPVLNRYSGGEKQDTFIDTNVIKDVIENATNDNLDKGDYYVIDLSAMENITLTYGEDYETLKEDENARDIQTLKDGTLTDVYIINSVSHNIFYVHGIKYQDKTYYSQYQDDEKSKIGDSNFDIDIESKVGRDIERNLTYTIEKGERSPSNRNAIYKDDKNYQAIIPAGFTVSDVDGESSIETGLVIRDDEGNEFVWIPVGIPKKSNSNEKIILGRYDFESDGTPIVYSGEYIEEDSSSRTYNYGNAVAKNINDFISKTNKAGGFWIGRYEARVEGYTGTVNTVNTDEKTSWTGYTGGKLVEKPSAQVFNYITQNKAAELSQNMYNSYCFKSDLINSYAWDTAALFLQEYDNRTYETKIIYSRQNSINTGGASIPTGTVFTEIKDNPCNVYDMASNCLEWSTETANDNNEPCVLRGGYFGSEHYRVRTRKNYNSSRANNFRTFRPILYIK